MATIIFSETIQSSINNDTGIKARGKLAKEVDEFKQTHSYKGVIPTVTWLQSSTGDAQWFVITAIVEYEESKK